MPAYTYLACDLMTNAILAELPMVQVAFDVQLNAAGSFSGRIPLGDSRVAAIDPFGSTQPGRTALFVDRDGRLVWGGIIWTRRYDDSTMMMEIGGSESWSYFDHRLLRPPLTPAGPGLVSALPGEYLYLGVDQIGIAIDLLTKTLAAAGSPTFLAGSVSSSGVLVDAEFKDFQLTVVSSAIAQLAQAANGFDFCVDVAYDSNGNPARTVNFSYPRRGASALSTGLVFDLPGNVMAYRFPEDATPSGNSVICYGTGAGGGMLLSSTADPSQLDGGYPLLELAVAYKNQQLQDQLDTYVSSQLSALKAPVVLPELDVNPAMDPVLGGYTVGDECRLVFRDVRFPNGLDAYYRIAGIKVTPQDTANEMVTLSLTNPFTG